MPSVRSTTASRSPRAAHRSSENQYGPIMAHALGSVRRRLILAGSSEGLEVEWGAPGRGAVRSPGPRPCPGHEPPPETPLLRLRPAVIALGATRCVSGCYSGSPGS